jgi:GNAT superfamily N-acetyltransferase
MTGMAGDILPMESSGHPALRFVRISDDSTIRAFAELNCVSYNVPAEMSLSFVRVHTLWHEHAYGFVAYEGDKPVSTATAIVNDGCLFLFLVATAPDARRKGYGEAAVRHALQTAYEETGKLSCPRVLEVGCVSQRRNSPRSLLWLIAMRLHFRWDEKAGLRGMR